MEIDVLTLSEVIERCVAAGIRRFKWGGLELEWAEPKPEAPLTPFVVPVAPRQEEPTDPYTKVFGGQRPAFPKFTAE